MGYTFMMILYLDYEFHRIFITEFTKDIYCETSGVWPPWSSGLEKWSSGLESAKIGLGVGFEQLTSK